MFWAKEQVILMYKQMCYESLLAGQGTSFIDKIAKVDPQFMWILGEVIDEDFPQFTEYFTKIAMLI